MSVTLRQSQLRNKSKALGRGINLGSREQSGRSPYSNPFASQHFPLLRYTGLQLWTLVLDSRLTRAHEYVLQRNPATAVFFNLYLNASLENLLALVRRCFVRPWGLKLCVVAGMCKLTTTGVNLAVGVQVMLGDIPMDGQ